MIGRELLKTEEITIIVKGLGKTIDEAVADIFKKIRSQVYKDLSVPIIQLETQGVTFDAVKEIEKKSLIPGKKEIEVHIEAKVGLQVKYLDIQKEEKEWEN